MDDQVETWANGPEDGEHVPDQPGKEQLGPGSDDSNREEESCDQAQDAHTDHDHQENHHHVCLLLSHRAKIIVVDVAETVHLNDCPLELVHLVSVKDPADDRCSDEKEVDGGEGDVECDDCGVEGGTAPGVLPGHVDCLTATTQLTHPAGTDNTNRGD